MAPGISVTSLTWEQLTLPPESITQRHRLVLPSADEAVIARFYILASPADLFLTVLDVKSSRSRHRQILCLVRVLFLAYRQPPSGCVLVTKRERALISSSSKDTNHTVNAFPSRPHQLLITSQRSYSSLVSNCGLGTWRCLLEVRDRAVHSRAELLEKPTTQFLHQDRI